MFSAIVYKSTTGSCKKYADLLSARLHIPAFPLGKEYIPADTKIIYVGWLFAGKIMGYDKAAKKYDIGAVVQVGMKFAARKTRYARMFPYLRARVHSISISFRRTSDL